MTEAQEQRDLIKWFRDKYPQYVKRTRLSLNGVSLGGGVKAARAINNLKAQGMVKDEADLVFMIPNKHFHGLVIEFKSTTGSHKASDGQLAYLDDLAGDGYAAYLCKGIESAKETIENYLNDTA